MPDVTLPRLADTLTEGTVSRWLKRPGEHVSRGEPLVEIETDKVNSEIESPSDGVLTEICAEEGSTVPVGHVIARIDGQGQTAHREEEPQRTGAAGGPSALAPIRRRIAERMQEARATVRQAACSREVDVSQVGSQTGSERAGWTARFVKALAAAGGFDDVGIAVEVPHGLVVPVLRGCRRRSTAEIDFAVRDLAERAREDRLAPADVLGGQFTVTNVGTVGTLLAFPLVSPGQPGILAPGAVADGRCWLTLCYDVERMDAAEAAALLAGVAEEIARA